MRKRLLPALPSTNLKLVLHKRFKPILILLSIALFIAIFFYILLIPSGYDTSFNIKKVISVATKHNLTLSINHSASNKINLLFVGDIMLSRSIGNSILANQNPFKNVQDFFQNYDVVVGNLETTIARNNTGVLASKGYNFKAPPVAASILKQSGIDIVSLANNHSMDYGEDALFETINYLNNSDVGSFGAGTNLKQAFEPFYIKTKNTNIAIIGLNSIENWIADVNQYHGGNAYFDKTLVKLALKDAQDNSDVVIVFPHWGDEYTTVISSIQKEWGRFFIDNGADLVIGSHPHIIQSQEIYKDKLIYYSLGNFVFDGMNGIPGASKGSMLEIIISDKIVKEHKEYFVDIDWTGFPTIIN